MATKKETLEAALRGEGCLGKAADDEPVFVLRAKDLVAPSAIEYWSERVRTEATRNESIQKGYQALEVANAFRLWQDAKSVKVKVPD